MQTLTDFLKNLGTLWSAFLINCVLVVSQILKSIAFLFIFIYQKLMSPFLPPACRFYPTCSHYAKQAYQEHSFIYATQLTIQRLLKCHPFGDSGFDPVPNKRECLR